MEREERWLEGTWRSVGGVTNPPCPVRRCGALCGAIPPCALGRGSAGPGAGSPTSPPGVGRNRDHMGPIKPHTPSLQGCSWIALGACSVRTGSIGGFSTG